MWHKNYKDFCDAHVDMQKKREELFQEQHPLIHKIGRHLFFAWLVVLFLALIFTGIQEGCPTGSLQEQRKETEQKEHRARVRDAARAIYGP